MRTVPPFGASTRAAALARRNAKSTVIGCSPTRPRTPSVPKYLRAIETLSLRYRRGHPDRVDCCGHIVGAHDTRSVENRNGGQGDASRSSIIDIPPGDLREHRLARQSDSKRHTHLLQPSEILEQRQIVDDALSKAEAGIDGESRALDACRTTRRYALCEKRAHLADDVVIAWRGLHGAWLALHVHEADAGPSACGRAKRVGFPQRAHVVDDVRASRAGSAHDFGFARIDGDERGRFAPQFLDDRHHALEFFVQAGGSGAGARRLTANVDDGGALFDHAARMRQGDAALDEATAIGKGIGRDVEYAHHHGSTEIEVPIPALPMSGRCHRSSICSAS